MQHVHGHHGGCRFCDPKPKALSERIAVACLLAWLSAVDLGRRRRCRRRRGAVGGRHCQRAKTDEGRGIEKCFFFGLYLIRRT